MPRFVAVAILVALITVAAEGDVCTLEPTNDTTRGGQSVPSDQAQTTDDPLLALERRCDAERDRLRADARDAWYEHWTGPYEVVPMAVYLITAQDAAERGSDDWRCHLLMMAHHQLAYTFSTDGEEQRTHLSIARAAELMAHMPTWAHVIRSLDELDLLIFTEPPVQAGEEY